MQSQKARGLLVIVSSFVLTAAFLLYSFPFVQVRENSMKPTLQEGDLLLLSRLAYAFSALRNGDVIVFQRHNLLNQPEADKSELEPPRSRKAKPQSTNVWKAILTLGSTKAAMPPKTPIAKPSASETGELYMIKRCVLTPENQLRWRGSQLYIPYLQDYIDLEEKVRQTLRKNDKLPQGHIFVLGDNAANSVDSRNYGLVPVSWIQGKALWLNKK